MPVLCRKAIVSSHEDFRKNIRIKSLECPRFYVIIISITCVALPKDDVIRADTLLDGVCVFVTNHTERNGRDFTVKPQAIIRAYRNKVKIEDVFKNVKSFLKLRPFFVNTDEHVSAVYTICMIAYFLNKYLANQRKLLGENDFLNSKALYAPFKDIDIVTLKDATTGEIFKKGVELPKATERLLKKLNLHHIVFGQEEGGMSMVEKM